MKVRIELDNAYENPEAIIRTAAISAEVQRAASLLADCGSPAFLAGFRDGAVRLLEPSAIRRVYASGGKVFAATPHGEYLLRMRLYEVERQLSGRGFIRISHSEILNLTEVDRFDFSLSGTILVVLSDGSTTFVSRRYVPRVREALGM